MSEWGRAGRPRKKPPKTDYTNAEKRIAQGPLDGMKMLAAAVLKQWIEDGKPDDIPMEWVAVLKELMR